MAATPSQRPHSKYEPIPRYHHTSSQAGNKVVVYSGATQDCSEQSKQRLASMVDVFDPRSELWEAKQTSGTSPPPRVYLASSASVEDDLFMFGGWDPACKWGNSLYQLDTKTYRWYRLSPQNAKAEFPMVKEAAGMAACDHNLALLGGHGLFNNSMQPGSSFIEDPKEKGIGWTNEFHIYHLEEGLWSSPTTTGERPPPCSLFSFTSIDHRRAVMFGGYNSEQHRMNDVYILDLQTMNWTKLNKVEGEPWPEERNNHAACCLNYGQQHPQLLVVGGMNSQHQVLKDAWILDVDSGRWRKVEDIPQPRRAHSVTAINLGPELTEVTMFGGTPVPWSASTEAQSKLADTTLLQFRLKENSWKLSGVVCQTELRQSEERLREKVESTMISSPQDSACSEKMGDREKDVSYEIDLVDLEFRDLLSRGGFGTVFRGKWKSKGLDVALKKVNITADASDAKVMRELGEHPNIISFYGFAHNYPETIMVMALAKNGSLYDYLHVKKEKPTQQQSLTWALQIAYGMAYMHKLDYVHRDLKSSNVLFSNNMIAQVSDFGTARFLKITTLVSKTAGTLRWMAPEVANDDSINKQCDVFSYALVIWELMEHNIPFPEARTDVMASVLILNGERPPISASWPDYLSSLTQACWVPAPNDRPTFSDIVTSLENDTYFMR